MKKLSKSNIFSFILGAIIFGSISVYATLTLTAEDVTYGSGTVKSALDTLYSRVKPVYTGSTTVTPTTSSQTLNTENTILNSNITVGAIPSSYKNLTTATTVAANKLLTGVTAYDNLGNLITGSINTDCVSGAFYTDEESASSTGKKIADFKPDYFIVASFGSNNWVGANVYNKNYSTTKFLIYDMESGTEINLTDYYILNSNGFYIRNWNARNSYLYYMACK